MNVPATSALDATINARQSARLLPGLVLSLLIGIAATAAGKLAWLQTHGMSGLSAAIILGMLLGSTVFPNIAVSTGSGVAFARQNLLRIGIVLYGFRLTMQDIGQVGITGVAIDALMLLSTFALAVVLGMRVFKLDRDTALLIGAGNSICGAAAIMATEPVVGARPGQVAVAVSTVVVFGSLAIFLYPAFYQWLSSSTYSMSGREYGIYIGSTVHEVAQVVAAAGAIGPDVANVAVVTKMVRVMMLAPFLVILSSCIRRGKGKRQDGRRLTIPWFAFAFIAVVAVNSFSIVPPRLVGIVLDADNMLLATAMAALGLSTQLSAIRVAGIKPLLLATVLFAWLVAGGALINHSFIVIRTYGVSGQAPWLFLPETVQPIPWLTLLPKPFSDNLASREKAAVFSSLALFPAKIAKAPILKMRKSW